MGRYITQAPRVKKQQVFTVSGTFTPSPGLLAAGGVVEVRCVGGGAGGAEGVGIANSNSASAYPTGAGGGSGADITRIVTVSAPILVMIGSGGSGGLIEFEFNPSKGYQATYIDPTSGGDTAFGELVIAEGGNPPLIGDKRIGGAAGGQGGFFGESASWQGTSPSNHYPGKGGGHGGASYGGDALPNTGGGGGGGGVFGGNGGSGLCIVTWEE